MERVPINIDPQVRERLLKLLFVPSLRCVGYSEFLTKAMDTYEDGLWEMSYDPEKEAELRHLALLARTGDTDAALELLRKMGG